MREGNDAFARLFTPFDGGYLYFPSKDAGGKFVTEAEYHALLTGHHATSGPKAMVKVVAAVVVAVAIGTLADDYFDAGGHIMTIAIWAVGLMVMAYFYWTSLAPLRLFKGRPDIVPPRPLADTKQIARSMIPWKHLLSMLLVSGLIFTVMLSASPKSPYDWLWVIGSGTFACLSAWIAVQKWRDRRVG
jgi:hypothetical protein